MPEKHTILGGKVHVYRRDNSSRWQCATYLQGKNRRVSTKEDGLSKAKDFAEDWYLQLRGKARAGEIRDEKTFRDAAAQFFVRVEVTDLAGNSARAETPNAIVLDVNEPHATVIGVLTVAVPASAEQADAAAVEPGIDYFCTGPCWPTPTKRGRPGSSLITSSTAARARVAAATLSS